MGSIKTTQYRKETVQTAHQMNMACVLKKDSHSQKQALGSRLDLALDSPWRLELRWSLPVKFILLPDTVLFISNCQHSVSAKEAQEHVGVTGRPAQSWHLLMVVNHC